MSNTTKNLWGDIPVKETVRTPYTLLKEQASELTKATQNQLVGEVAKFTDDKDKIVCVLEIRVPDLDDYIISIAEIIYDIDLFPLKIRASFSDTENTFKECNTEAEFEITLGEILSSPRVKRIIAILLSEIRAEKEAYDLGDSSQV